MSEAGEFECMRCATCCRNVLENRGTVRRGLPLTEKEAQLFPREAVSPKLAIGSEKPSRVILHQLNVNVCPHINSKNGCNIYEKRPLICRSFPIVTGAISNRCRVFSYRKVGVAYDEPYTMQRQLEADAKLEKHVRTEIKKHPEKGQKLWEYDLASKKWLPIK